MLAKGVDIARAAGASVLIYHAVAIPPEFPPAAATNGGDPLPAHLHRVATERLQAHGIRDVPCEISVEEAQRAWRAILDAASKYEAGVVVIGSHGYDLVGIARSMRMERTRRGLFSSSSPEPTTPSPVSPLLGTPQKLRSVPLGARLRLGGLRRICAHRAQHPRVEAPCIADPRRQFR